MKPVKVKAFLHALQIMPENLRTMKSFLRDKRITQAEKKILECWLLLAENRLDEILEILPKLNTDYDQLVESQKNLLLGKALSNKTQYVESIPYIKKAIEGLRPYALNRQKFNATYSLFIVYLNLKNEKAMKETLNALKKIEIEHKYHEICLIQCEFNYCALVEQYKEAKVFLTQLKKYQTQMSGALLASTLTSQFLFYVKLEDFTACEKTMEEMKKQRKYELSSNFTFMRLMLDHYLHEKPMYVYQQEFKDQPISFYQLKVIQCLEEQSPEEALGFWKKLQMSAPDIYLPDFSYKGDKCIFSLCLDKHLSRPKKSLEFSNLPENKVEALYIILSEANAPVRKEVIHQLLWKEELIEKSDNLKLKKVISRVREKYDVDIQFKKGCYCIEKGAKKQAA